MLVTARSVKRSAVDFSEDGVNVKTYSNAEQQLIILFYPLMLLRLQRRCPKILPH